jgi:hypothetical protein
MKDLHQALSSGCCFAAEIPQADDNPQVTDVGTHSGALALANTPFPKGRRSIARGVAGPSGTLRNPARLTAEDVIVAARYLHGLERMEGIKFAIFEANGKISVIPCAPHSATVAAQPS